MRLGRGLISVIVVALFGLLGTARTEDHVWLDAAGAPLPVQDEQVILDYLRTASIVSDEPVGFGTADAYKLLLEKDGIQIHAVFRHVDVTRRNFKIGGQTIPVFRDDCKFEVAAYRLSERLGMNSVPPTVLRRHRGKAGTVQLWVENAIMEKKRSEEKLQFPPASQRMFQWQMMYLFDSLIYNDDRNQGNILYDEDAHIWMIDHTRAFRNFEQPRNLNLIRYCDRSVYEGLQQLEEAALKEELEDVLTSTQIKAILKRRDGLMDYLNEMIAKRGEDAVLH